ncbi:MAG: ABC transporter permease, partial [Actinomycetia bacterium]|nr:ABC transporter permease [Actinomycetes bacterium]
MSQIQIMWDSRPLVANFAQRELKARYRRSLLGWLWS